MPEIDDTEYKIVVSDDCGLNWQEVDIPQPTEYQKGLWCSFYSTTKYNFRQEMYWNRYNDPEILNRIRVKYAPSLCIWWTLWKVRNVFLWIKLRFRKDKS